MVSECVLIVDQFVFIMFFFFFKQKTAYEIYQCDWSSDVCSSDLFRILYKGKGLLPGQGSFTFRYWIGAKDHTLSSQEIEEFRGQLLAFMRNKGIGIRA